MYQNALLTTDGSKTAEAALQHVPQVVDPRGSVTILSVIDDVSRVLGRTTPAGFEFGSTGAFGASIAQQVVDAQRTAAEEHVREARDALKRAGLRTIETVVAPGLPGPRIVREARARGCDVVIMATHGRSGLQRTVLGSVADHVLRHLDDIPVLLVHPGGKHDA